MATLSDISFGGTDVCSNVGVINKTLQCYQCISHLTDKKPQCDSHLWKHLRHSEKFKLRTRCPASKSKTYCTKRIRQKFGERITERGCYKDNSEHRTKKGNEAIAEGCKTFPEQDFLTTICFCGDNLCNSASQFQYSGKVYVLLGTVSIFWAGLYLLLCLIIDIFH